MKCDGCGKNYADSFEKCPYCGVENPLHKSKLPNMNFKVFTTLSILSAFGFLLGVFLSKVTGIIIIVVCIMVLTMHIYSAHYAPLKEDGNLSIKSCISTATSKENRKEVIFNIANYIFSIAFIAVISITNINLIN